MQWVQIYAGAGGNIGLKQPTFDNYALAAHYYGQTRKKFVVYPFDGVRGCLLSRFFSSAHVRFTYKSQLLSLLLDRC